MYAVPAGLGMEKTEDDLFASSAGAGGDPGDDDAAAAFRRQFMESSDPSGEALVANHDGLAAKRDAVDGNGVGDALKTEESAEKKVDNRTALEKSVNRPLSAAATTLEQQLERFPQLKNAPIAGGMKGTNVSVSFKPLGMELRNVRCMKCGEWGHSKGDRECKVDGWNPFAPKSTVIMKAPIMMDKPDGVVLESKPDDVGYYGPSSTQNMSTAVEGQDVHRSRSDNREEKYDKPRKKKDRYRHHRHRRRRSHSSDEYSSYSTVESLDRSYGRSRSKSRSLDREDSRRGREKNRHRNKRHRCRERDRKKSRHSSREDRQRQKRSSRGGHERDHKRYHGGDDKKEKDRHRRHER
uniref:CBF1-interacting co-repressor CIR N-terminal domain-containing protein n=1 Tax=Corethron hystrix TaxID=216773 RepID=A0A7S1G1C1_9STRA